MTISAQYETISEICIQQGANFEQWQKTAEMDKIFLLLYDQLDGRNSAATRTERAQALVEYLGIKRSYADSGFSGNLGDGDVRQQLRNHSFTNSLTNFNQGQFGLCGRFHRVLSQVLNEVDNTGGVASQEAIFRIWCNQAVRGMAEGLNYLVAPFVAETTGYRIDTNDIVINDGSDIEGTDAVTRIRLYSQGINFASQIWQKDTVDLPGETSDVLNLQPAVITDTGVYRNSYTNAYGTSYSDDFNVVVT